MYINQNGFCFVISFTWYFLISCLCVFCVHDETRGACPCFLFVPLLFFVCFFLYISPCYFLNGSYHLTWNSPIDQNDWPMTSCYTPMSALPLPQPQCWLCSSPPPRQIFTQVLESQTQVLLTDTSPMNHLPRPNICIIMKLYHYSIVAIALTISCDLSSLSLGICCARHFIKLFLRIYYMANNRNRALFNYTHL